uniref:Uncharacterized protein n=1 Tax=viral metagenome TaxID=1070528 RepID=A0A6M3IK48_9ZZZZ
MQDGKQLKYGWIRGGEEGENLKVAATQYIAAASGKFVRRTNADSLTVTLAVAGDSDILGHLETEALNSSDGTEVRKVIYDPTAVFRIPVNGGTFTNAMIGKQCDLSVASGIQGAALDSSSSDVLVIVGGDDVNNIWVDVRLSVNKTYAGVV